jgi:hypothetical protein
LLPPSGRGKLARKESIVLSGLLPGLRELRAPLSAGYLWLLVLWIAFEPLIPTEEEASGIWDSLSALSDVVSAIGIGVALSFAAYLLGALSEAVFSWVMATRERLLINRAAPAAGTSPSESGSSTAIAALPRDRGSADNELLEVGRQFHVSRRGLEAIDDVTHDPLNAFADILEDRDQSLSAVALKASLLENSSGTLRSIRGREMSEFSPITSLLAQLGERVVQRGMSEPGARIFLRIPREDPAEPRGPDAPVPRDPTKTAEEDSRQIERALQKDAIYRRREARPWLSEVLRDAVLGELDQMRTQLIGKEPQLFSEIDRLRAEAEFRAAIVPPLVALAGVLAWRLTWWSAIIAVLAAIVLFRQGLQRASKSNDALLEALRIGRSQLPTITRLEAVTQQLSAEAVTDQGLAQWIRRGVTDVRKVLRRARRG